MTGRGRGLHRGPGPGLAVCVTLGLLGAAPVGAQQPVTLEEALAAALRDAPRMAAARADSGIAEAAVREAALYPNPALALGYSRSPPQYHLELEQELEYPWVRGPRIDAARAALDAASLRAELERARIRYDVMTAYADAAAARQVAALSTRQAADGEELVRIARERRDAGDASDLDVDLARVNAAQLRSTLLSDSLAMASATLELQSAMGLPPDSIRVVPVDTLPGTLPPVPDAMVAVAAGIAERRAAERRVTERVRGRVPAPSLRAGFEEGDPSGDEKGILPTVGVSIPIPLFHGQGAAIAAARAQAERAAADLAQARRDADLAVALAERERELALARLDADRAAVESARRVARLSLAAYREGAYPLATVLEAQRSARDAERQVLDDIAALRTADATVLLARLGGVRP